jgi:hypothetical protein
LRNSLGDRPLSNEPLRQVKHVVVGAALTTV